VRIGIVGVGRIGSFHAQTLAADPTVTDLVLLDPSATAAAAVASQLGATVAPDLDALLR